MGCVPGRREGIFPGSVSYPFRHRVLYDIRARISCAVLRVDSLLSLKASPSDPALPEAAPGARRRPDRDGRMVTVGLPNANDSHSAMMHSKSAPATADGRLTAALSGTIFAFQGVRTVCPFSDLYKHPVDNSGDKLVDNLWIRGQCTKVVNRRSGGR